MVRKILKFKCKLFSHKPINKELIYESDYIKFKTFYADCERCKEKLFGIEEKGKFSGKLINSWILLSKL